MQSETFIITGGFRDEDSSEGYLGQLELRRDGTDTHLTFTPLIITEPPDKKLKIPNKGFAGGSIYHDILWVSTANQLLGYCLNSFTLKHVINNSLFNDLHYVLAHEKGLYVVNTGLESIDFLNYSGELLERILLTSVERTWHRVNSISEFRTWHSEPHFMHANFCAFNEEGDLMVTLLKQQQVINLKNWNLVSAGYLAPPHDGFMAYYPPENKKLLWITTLSGKVIASDNKSNQIAQWNLYDYKIPIGWVRGLSVLEHGFLVGISKLTHSNYAYHAGWQVGDCKNSQTTIVYIPFDSASKATFISIFLDRKAAKIFSIIKKG